MFLRFSLPLFTVLAVTLGGCGDDASSAEAPEPAPAEEPTVAEAPTPEATADPSPTPAGPMVPPFCPGDGAPNAGAELSDPRFTIRAVAADTYTSGELGQFRVEIDAAEGWHVNQEFNTQLHVRSSEALQLDATTIGQPAASEFDDHHARFAVPVTPTSAGEHRAETCLSFAICSDETCIPVAPSVAVVLPVQ